jgi:predicted ATP-dependent endonuclease of OLD family
MKIAEVRIHNYRCILDQTFHFGSYSLLIGANNSGKSNILDALRVFYEKDLRFEHTRDFPKFATDDEESWVEVTYELSDEEATTLEQKYRIEEKKFCLRKWFHPPEKAKGGWFAYQDGTLSKSPFYGGKSASQRKLGNIIYIPAVSRLEEHTKLTGPSALRELIHDVLKPIIHSSGSFVKLRKDFEEFGKVIKSEETSDKRSLSDIEAKINAEIRPWGAQFNLGVVSPHEDYILKNLIGHTITDGDLQLEMDSESFGHGFQRHLILALIRISANSITSSPEPKRNEFSPEFELILFDEPEAFLHPPRQNLLDTSLRQLTAQSGKQVIAATHSPLFVSCNTDSIADLIILRKAQGRTEIGQITRENLQNIFEDNQRIRQIIQTSKNQNDKDLLLDLETAKHFLWLNPERCSLFFANRVLIVEGLSEQVLINHLLKEGKLQTDGCGVFVLEVAGKYNIHRFMNLLSQMKIEHAVLYDKDNARTGEEKEKQDALSQLIRDSKNPYTVGMDTLPDNLESFLGIKVPKEERRWKASHVLVAYKRGMIKRERMERFVEKVQRLLEK